METATGPQGRVVLINPRFPESFWSFQFAVRHILPDKRAVNPPLGLATLAALCPSDWEVSIVDENIESIPLAPDADIVGVCGMGIQFPRQAELLRYYRQQGYHVVAGGSYASLCPQDYAELADTVIAGEAEYIWPTFCDDYIKGTTAPLYQESGVVDLADSPIPRFDLLKLDRYSTASMQFSRGCPYRCEFCDIIVMFGRRPRTKTPAQVGRELDELRRLDIRNIFFVDDNLIGNKPKARELLAYLRDYQQTHDYHFSFGVEASLNLAEDEELLHLFRAAHFGWAFIGIESPDEASLKEMKKTQNLRGDLLDSVRTLYRHGIDVMAGFIVGFDNDTLETFERQRSFIMRSGIQVAMVGLLTALPKTPLYHRLNEAGRLIKGSHGRDNTGTGTNVVPLRMDYDAMVEQYKGLYRTLQTNAGIGRRIESKMRYLRAPIHRVQYPVKARLTIFARLLFKLILPGGPGRLAWFIRTHLTTRPAAWPQVMTDWITGLALRDYVERHFAANTAEDQWLISKTLERLRRIGRRGLARGSLDLSASLEAGGKNLALTVRGYVNRRFLTRAGKRLERLLHRSTATVTLHIEALAEGQREQMQKLLQRLSGYGDRIFIHVSANLRPLLEVDSSVFNLVLVEDA